ncbi:MAG: hypothetical protein JWR61_109 [Ferruginibacter sp.]|uniref:hypothetical protein n=1 Tax=Ferruginibacter sp. TaxID=1940288 RepID=UPI002657F5EF|nr:hypothetical protein [Ferruginibacter sp.]MDB5275154.1 hypothetical protein [Ferruginibacter sp.]
MERNLDIDSFERLLKDRSDEFKMYPEKRVWHSIYNNIHPGRKWPSVAMSITLIGILLLTGYLNTDTKNAGKRFASQNQHNETKPADPTTSIYIPLLDKKHFNNQPSKPFANNSTLNFSGQSFIDNIEQQDMSSESVNNLQEPPNLVKTLSGVTNKSTGDNLTHEHFISLAKIESTEIAPIKNDPDFKTIPANRPAIFHNKVLIVSLDNSENKIRHQNVNNVTSEKNMVTGSETDLSANDVSLKNKALLSAETISTDKNETLILSDEEKAWVENYAMYNRPAPKKWAGKLGWQMYFTPSVVYRQLKNTISDGADVNQDVAQHPSYGLEIGSGFTYPVLKGLRIRTGLQLNFTMYNSDAFTNSHPVATTITLVSSESHQPYPAYRSTSYSNIDGISTVKLHNETFQISLPVGMDLKIAGNENLQWNIGATIQPTYVMGGKSYLLSSDKRNYIKETSLLNHWNVNAGFETFVSYKTDKGITFQFGPQFRKQLFTTNSKRYIIQEKLNNYGFKFGITKLLK